jgi:formylglycine-generating enzyme required for sulfatase activity
MSIRGRAAGLAACAAVVVAACAPAPPPLAPARILDAEFVLIQPGSFDMGNMQGSHGHTVTLTRPFLIQKTELTQAEWVGVMGSNPSYFDACGPTCPVENISFENVQAFIARLNERSGRRYRLPTEAEWEYAARAGSEAELFPDAWIERNSNRTTHPVGQLPPNAWGLYDMEGNVAEWVSDWHGFYPLDAVTNPMGPPVGAFRILRGGSWMSAADSARATSRRATLPALRLNFAGFRLARTP